MAQIKEAWGDDEELLRRVQSGSSQMAMLYTRNKPPILNTHNNTPTNTTKTREGGEDVSTLALCLYFRTLFYIIFSVLLLLRRLWNMR